HLLGIGAEAAREAAHERRLARAQLARQEDDLAAAEVSGQFGGDLLGLGGGARESATNRRPRAGERAGRGRAPAAAARPGSTPGGRRPPATPRRGSRPPRLRPRHAGTPPPPPRSIRPGRARAA